MISKPVRGRPTSAVCGTISGYGKHRRFKEEICALCKKAWNIYHREKARPAAEYIEIYKLNLGCFDCGYNSHAHALDFDHLRDKKFNIALAIGSKSLPIIIAEIEKCEVVCANCHRIRTANRRINLKGE